MSRLHAFCLRPSFFIFRLTLINKMRSARRLLSLAASAASRRVPAVAQEASCVGAKAVAESTGQAASVS